MHPTTVLLQNTNSSYQPYPPGVRMGLPNWHPQNKKEHPTKEEGAGEYLPPPGGSRNGSQRGQYGWAPPRPPFSPSQCLGVRGRSLLLASDSLTEPERCLSVFVLRRCGVLLHGLVAVRFGATENICGPVGCVWQPWATFLAIWDLDFSGPPIPLDFFSASSNRTLF